MDAFEQKITEHNEQLKAIRLRLTKIERNQLSTEEVIISLRQKIFNGYDESIRYTSRRVDEIMRVVTALANKGGIDEAHIQALIDKSISEYDSSQLREGKADSRWIREHWQGIIGSIGTVLSVTIGALGAFGVL